jgi:hypothetical protein
MNHPKPAIMHISSANALSKPAVHCIKRMSMGKGMGMATGLIMRALLG